MERHVHVLYLRQYLTTSAQQKQKYMVLNLRVGLKFGFPNCPNRTKELFQQCTEDKAQKKSDTLACHLLSSPAQSTN